MFQALIAMRKEPQEPVRNPAWKWESQIVDGDTLESFVLAAQEVGLSLSDVAITCEGFYENKDYYFSAVMLEPESVWQERYNKYLKDKADYDSWYTKNRKLIEQERVRLAEKQATKKQQEADKLRKELERIKKKLSKLEGQ